MSKTYELTPLSSSRTIVLTTSDKSKPIRTRLENLKTRLNQIVLQGVIQKKSGRNGHIYVQFKD